MNSILLLFIALVAFIFVTAMIIRGANVILGGHFIAKVGPKKHVIGGQQGAASVASTGPVSEPHVALDRALRPHIADLRAFVAATVAKLRPYEALVVTENIDDDGPLSGPEIDRLFVEFGGLKFESEALIEAPNLSRRVYRKDA